MRSTSVSEGQFFHEGRVFFMIFYVAIGINVAMGLYDNKMTKVNEMILIY